MTVWLDAQISPAMAVWLRMRFDLDAQPIRDLGLRDAEDPDIFAAAKSAGVVVMTKDGAPVPQVRNESTNSQAAALSPAGSLLRWVHSGPASPA